MGKLPQDFTQVVSKKEFTEYCASAPPVGTFFLRDLLRAAANQHTGCPVSW